MVRVDFTNYKCFSACPNWWRNFVLFTTKGKTNKDVDKAIADGMSKFNGIMVEDKGKSEDVEELIFETENDFNAFKIYWVLYGE
jgi:hypothetical protein